MSGVSLRSVAVFNPFGPIDERLVPFEVTEAFIDRAQPLQGDAKLAGDLGSLIFQPAITASTTIAFGRFSAWVRSRKHRSIMRARSICIDRPCRWLPNPPTN